MKPFNQLTGQIIGAAAIEAHREKGSGLLEPAREGCLCLELASVGLRVARQVAIPLIHKGVPMDTAFRADLTIENRALAELKAIEPVLPVHEAQLSSYIRETGHETGLLVNLNVPRLVDGLTCIVNDRPVSGSAAISVLKHPPTIPQHEPHQ